MRGRAAGLLAAGAAVSWGAALLCFQEEVKAGTWSSLQYCLGVLVPSLFPFMVLAGFMVCSGAGDALGKPLGPVTRGLFRLPGCAGASVLLSFLAGYPAGAKGAALLLEQGEIDREQAGRMLLFCVNPGTAFVVTYLGGGVLHSYRTGWLLFFSVTLSGLALGALVSLWGRKPANAGRAGPGKPEGALVRAVSGAAQSVVAMCACIVAFAGFTAILHGAGVFQALVQAGARLGVLPPTETAVALSFLWEVTGGVGAAAEFRAGPALYAFGLAFGGLCVHLQVFAMFPKLPIKKRYFFLCRFLHGLLAAGCCQLLCRLLPGLAVEALAPAAGMHAAAFSGTALGGLSMVLLCAAFLLAVGKEEAKGKV